MSKDRRRAVFAIVLALSLGAGAGSAGATDAPLAASIGAGIDHTMRAPVSAVRSQVSVVDAIDRLNRPAAQPLPARQPLQALAPPAIRGLRGLVVPGGLDVALSALSPGPSNERVTTPRPFSRAAPYVRFSEQEQVLGLSFKIEPPPPVPEMTSPPS